jgi:hypothetical protein
VIGRDFFVNEQPILNPILQSMTHKGAVSIRNIRMILSLSKKGEFSGISNE